MSQLNASHSHGHEKTLIHFSSSSPSQPHSTAGLQPPRPTTQELRRLHLSRHVSRPALVSPLASSPGLCPFPGCFSLSVEMKLIRAALWSANAALSRQSRNPYGTRSFSASIFSVLLKADFRNVQFLANFITEAGVIIKRSKTGISAKAQRKVAREIKTARAFGLMPFTTMGTKQFKYGTTMEDEDRDFEYETYEYNFVNEDRGDDVDA
ncbi:Ribosomal protein S18 [Striga hermonthica]|uniref:Small ribosomal subunit protein bS18c n=1 Tax=Striga hermonthica TaxID=68872 RepID=A0A9N7MYB5_STRHE|nr:Ribosomal protein S18 [Striga hermonthica]